MTVKVSALAHIPKMFKSRVSLPMTPTAQMKDGRIPLLLDMSLCGRSPEASEWQSISLGPSRRKRPCPL